MVRILDRPPSPSRSVRAVKPETSTEREAPGAPARGDGGTDSGSVPNPGKARGSPPRPATSDARRFRN